jgi:hypothetical protein
MRGLLRGVAITTDRERRSSETELVPEDPDPSGFP